TDPNPIHGGRSARILARRGIQVSHGVLGEECRALIRPFERWVRTGRPWVTLKSAMSLDGKIASVTGRSRWISSADSRRRVQEIRRRSDAILIGARTALKDDPRLDVRGGARKELTKIVLDSRLVISPKARLFGTPGPVIVATTRYA
ncbi:MAG: dihydrofolate reductase family protein, partial [Candidatus Omnitrophica bacterium]|nr:dihydrofolate reductase family protein [Candidatus Omnitrophota bacterium]